MLEYRKPDLLSIWEVATRLHEIDPETATIETLPSDARETLRNLVTAQEHNFNIFDVDGNELLSTFIPIINVVKKHPVAKRLVRMAKDRQFDKDFLDSVYIAKDEYEYLMLKHNQPVSAFWFSDDEIEYHNQQRLEAHGKLPENNGASETTKPKSERHIKAAQIKHAPQKAVIQQFVAFYLAGSFASKAHAARIFLATLPKEKRELFSIERAERTLADALPKNPKLKSLSEGGN